jgi:Domain of unknown function (DUF4157)
MPTHDKAVTPDPAPKPSPLVQRKCDCGGAAAGSCHDCDRKRLHRSAYGAAPAAVPATVDGVLTSSGEPLDPSVRRDMETRFGHDFADVRIHRDAAAAASARDLGALAWTSGTHVAFGADRYSPATPAGRRLLGHELTHVLQQRHDRALQRQSAVSEQGDPAEREADRMAEQVAAPAAGFLADDDAATVSPGQMRRTEFLDELQRASCAAADAELARVERSTEGCPFVERAFSRFRDMPAAQVERAVRRYVDAAGATSARDYIPLVSARVAAGVARWATSGEMPDLPPELAGGMPGGGGVLSMLGGGLASIAGGIGRLFFKRDEGASGTAAESDPSAVASQLGGGASLDSRVRGRMENAYGYDFSNVRVHTDGRAAALSSSLGARAFTVGRDVAFGASEYRPGTPSGDALIAHELAHVVQQSAGGSIQTPAEGDADRSAAAVMLSLWGGAKQIARNALPRARSGLALHRCGSRQTVNPPLRTTAPAPEEAARMTPYALSQMEERWLTGDPLRDYARARLLIRCIFAAHHVDFDPDNMPVVGAELDAAQRSAATAARGIVVSGSAPFRPAGAVNDAPIRIVGGLQWAAKRYQLEMIVSGVGPRADEFVRELYPTCNITPHAGATIVDPERKIAAFNQFAISASHTLGAFYHPYDNVIYLGQQLAANLTSTDPAERTDAAQTVGHETVHSLGGRQNTVAAFRARFPGPTWICYWSVFEEGMAEDETMRTMSGGTLRPDDVYQVHVEVMREVMNTLGEGRVRRAYFSGQLDDDIFRELQTRVPLERRLSHGHLAPACDVLYP